jgi:hypothetical protein
MFGLGGSVGMNWDDAGVIATMRMTKAALAA